MAVLTALRQENNFLSLHELLLKLGSNFKERSTRRWLSLLVNEGLVEKTGKKKTTRYRAIKREEAQWKSPESLPSLQYVRLALFERKPVAYHEQWLADYLPNHTTYLTAPIKRELLEAGQRNKDKEPARTYAKRIYHRLLIDLSYHSSRLEGNTYSLVDTQRLILEGKSVAGKLDEGKIMILNHKEAIRYLVDNAKKIEVSPETIFTLHYLLADGLVEFKYAGKLRDQGVRIGGSTYLPIENPRQLDMVFKQIFTKGSQIKDPFEQSFFLLTHLSYLQAFIDVNERTARLSANIPLIKNNLVPLSFNDIGREDYTSSIIAVYELNDIHPLRDLFTHSYLRTCQMYNATVETVGYDEVRVRYRIERRAIIRHIIVQLLTGKAMGDYISLKTKELVKEKDQASFLEDIQEDLSELAPQHIAGLGITIEELNQWQSISAERHF